MTAAARHTQTAPDTALQACCLITDGNAHRADLSDGHRALDRRHAVSEALLPEIRTLALLIAAERHDFNRRSPQVFADEADWFAARILLLRARIFHLDISLNGMLDTANRRARDFAAKHRLPFTAAKIRAGLHTKRPAALLLCECDLHLDNPSDFIENSRQIRRQLHKML